MHISPRKIFFHLNYFFRCNCCLKGAHTSKFYQNFSLNTVYSTLKLNIYMCICLFFLFLIFLLHNLHTYYKFRNGDTVHSVEGIATQEELWFYPFLFNHFSSSCLVILVSFLHSIFLVSENSRTVSIIKMKVIFKWTVSYFKVRLQL